MAGGATVSALEAHYKAGEGTQLILENDTQAPGVCSMHTLQLDAMVLVTSGPCVDPAACDPSAQTMRLALVIQPMITRQGCGGRRMVAARNVSPPPSELSRSGAPLIPASRLVAFDPTSLLHLRDWQKIAVLAPACLRRDLAALDAAGVGQLAALAQWQDGLRNCTSVLVFDPDHATRLLALGAPQVELARLPALMPFQDTAPAVDLLLIDHAGEADATLCQELASALRQALPDLVVGHARTDGASDVAARIHLHVGTAVGTNAAIRVMDSLAMHCPVIQFARTPQNVDPAMWVEAMQTGLRAETLEATIDALRWLDAHPVFIDIFRGHATNAVGLFNGAAEATLRDALMSVDPA